MRSTHLLGTGLLAVGLVLLAQSCGDESLDELKERRAGATAEHPETDAFMTLFRAAEAGPAPGTFRPLIPYIGRTDLFIVRREEIVSQTAKDLTENLMRDHLEVAVPVLFAHLRGLQERMPEEGWAAEALARELQHPLRFTTDMVVGRNFVSGRLPDVTLVLPYLPEGGGEAGTLEIGYFYRQSGQMPGEVIRIDRLRLGALLDFIEENVDTAILQPEREGNDEQP